VGLFPHAPGHAHNENNELTMLLVELATHLSTATAWFATAYSCLYHSCLVAVPPQTAFRGRW